jgi:general secretion pathway protein K
VRRRLSFHFQAAMEQRIPIRRRQQGVAIVTALLLTSLTVMLVTSLFWQQQVQARSLENQRLRLQTQWLLRSTIDWARVMLREDINASSVDHLGEQWARPLSATQIDQYIQDAGSNHEMSDAVLSGAIIDAQSRYNLRNLVIDGKVNAGALAIFQRLLEKLELKSSLAQAVADALEAQSPLAVVPGDGSRAPATARTESGGIRIEYLEDLLSIPGFTPEVLSKLKDHVVILPNPTDINANTASAIVLAARLGSLTTEEAQELVASRDRIYFRDGGDLINRLKGKVPDELAGSLAFSTTYFLVNGKVKVRHSAVNMQALVERNLMMSPRVIWIRDH